MSTIAAQSAWSRGRTSIARVLPPEQRGVLSALIVMGVILTFASPFFLTPANIGNLLVGVALVGIVAAGETLVMLSGGLDISVGSIVALAGVVSALVLTATHNAAAAVFAGIAIGALAGLANGVIITTLRINALIVTLATLSIYLGLTYIVADGKAVGATDTAFAWLGNGGILGVPNPIILLVVVFLVGHFVLTYTTIGRNIYAMGGNAEAARLSGLNLSRYRIALYTVSGLLAGISGVVLTARLGSGQPIAGAGLELTAIAAVVLGGTSLSGGIGSMFGTAIGVLVLGTLSNGLILLRIPAFYQYLARGAVLLLAVGLDHYRGRLGSLMGTRPKA
jgi:ribose/xylose/arabinose/galactoside ABC-type transport system permease subunit